jgi:hypothetical protein
MTAWHSLYLPYADTAALAQALESSLIGYTLYDPFGIMPMTKAYAQTVKAFVSPVENGWSRVLLAPHSPIPQSVIDALSSLALVFAVSLVESDAMFGTFENRVEVDLLSALSPYASPDLLHKALSLSVSSLRTSGNNMPFDVLQGDMKAMADKVNVKEAEKMFNRMAGKLLQGDQKDAARELLNSAVDWNSAGGKRIEAVMGCLPMEKWREPEYVALRDAYALHNRRRRNPNASLYPGDREAMELVPNALEYVPVFAGKND